MAYTNPILGAVLGNQSAQASQKQFEANYALSATQLGLQAPGMKADAEKTVLANEKVQLQELHHDFRNNVMDQETMAFPTPQQLQADPAWNQRVVDFYNSPLIKNVWDNDGTGKQFKGWVPVSDTQAVMELSDPNASPQERKFVTEKGTSDPADNPLLFDENGYNRFNGKIMSKMENASGMLGQFGRNAVVDQANSARNTASTLVNGSALQLGRQDLNAAAGNPNTSAPAPQQAPQQAPATFDQQEVIVPTAFGTQGGNTFGTLPKSGGRSGNAGQRTLRKFLHDTGDAARLSEYSPEELDRIDDATLLRATKHHEDAIKAIKPKRTRQGARGQRSGTAQALTEDQDIAIAQHTAALDQIKGLASSRMSIGYANNQNAMQVKATNNAVRNQSVSTTMATDPNKAPALDAAIKADMGSDPKAIENAVTAAGKTIGGMKPNKKMTNKDAYQLSLLKAAGTIDQATFNRIVDVGVFSSDTIDLVKNNVDAQVSVLKEQMKNAAKVKADAIKAQAALTADEKSEDGQAYNDMTDLTEQWNENPDQVKANLFAANNSDGGLSETQNGFLSIKIAESLNKKLSVDWLSDPWDRLTRGNISPQDQAVGLNSYALKDDGQIVFVDQHGKERGNAETYLSQFTPDEQKYLKQELGDVARAQIHSVVTKYKDLERRVNDQETDQKLIPELKQQMADLRERAAKLTQTNVQGAT